MSRITPSPEEASANGRQFARQLRDLYVAMLAEGFSHQDAMDLLSRIVIAGIAAGVTGDQS